MKGRDRWKGRGVPEPQEKHVVEFVFAKCPRNSDEEGLAEERRAGVVVARLLVLFSQLHWNHYMLRVFHPVHWQLKAAWHGYLMVSEKELTISRADSNITLTCRCRPAP